MELLIETYTANEANILTESSQDGKNVSLSGIFMQAEQKNRNGRIYKLNEMINAVQSLNETIQAHGGILSEVDHPSSRLHTELKSAGAIITEVAMSGNNATGKMRILNTPCGLIVKEVIKAGFRPGVSSRGAGNVGSDGVVEGFLIQSVDIVVTPSASGAMPIPMYEGIEQLKTGNKVLTLAEALIHDVSAQKYFTKEIYKFMEELTKYKK